MQINRPVGMEWAKYWRKVSRRERRKQTTKQNCKGIDERKENSRLERPKGGHTSELKAEGKG